MNRINFSKYQGTGNDFVIIRGIKALSEEQIHRLCDRHWGIGADGVILINESSHYDFDMRYYNSDGSESFCGNGSRCAVRYAHHHGIVGEQCTFHTTDGEHHAKLTPEQITISLADVASIEKIGDDYIINTGSPHFIRFMDEISELDMPEFGRSIRYSPPFSKEGINVNAVKVNGSKIAMRTYERGVEDETLSCGSGVTAVALAYTHQAGLNGQQQVQINTQGGRLTVDLSAEGEHFYDIYLSGPATFVFEGGIDI